MKLRTLAAEFTDTLEQIHIALEGITKGSRMAFDVVRSEIEEGKQRLTKLEELSKNSTQVILPSTDIDNVGLANSSLPRPGKEL